MYVRTHRKREPTTHIQKGLAVLWVGRERVSNWSFTLESELIRASIQLMILEDMRANAGTGAVGASLASLFEGNGTGSSGGRGAGHSKKGSAAREGRALHYSGEGSSAGLTAPLKKLNTTELMAALGTVQTTGGKPLSVLESILASPLTSETYVHHSVAQYSAFATVEVPNDHDAFPPPSCSGFSSRLALMR